MKLVADKVPEKINSTFQIAFAKAFSLILKKGTSVIEKTYRGQNIEKTYKIP